MSIEELWNSEQDLHVDLRPYIISHPSLGKILHHPLICEVPYLEQMNALINERYKHKVKDLDEASKAKDWSRVISIHERPYRWEALNSILPRLSDQELINEFSWVWSDSENIWQNHRMIKKMINLIRQSGLKYQLMSANDLKHFNNLPETILVYRGCRDHNIHGLSWTESEEEALWFTKRLARKSDKPLLVTGKIQKSDVLFYTNSRNEHEIVAMSRKAVCIQSKIYVKQSQSQFNLD